jgi:hypothetical protein
MTFREFVHAYWPLVCDEPFQERPYHLELFEILEAARAGPAAILLIMPPASGKSLLVNVLWPMWLASLDSSPGTDVLLTSHRAVIAHRNWTKCRDIGTALFGRQMIVSPSRQMVTPHGGKTDAMSITGAFLGIRADVILIDELYDDDRGEQLIKQHLTDVCNRLILILRQPKTSRVVLTCTDIVSSIQESFVRSFDKVFPPRVMVKRLE